MGYMRYTVQLDGQEIEAGYGVPDTCNADGCKIAINRGLDYLCGSTPGGDENGCGHYFCTGHLQLSSADGTPKMCDGCMADYIARRLDAFADVVAAALADTGMVKSADVLDGAPVVAVVLEDGFEVEVHVKF